MCTRVAAAGLEPQAIQVLAPVVRDRKGEFAELFADMQAQGYVRFRVDGAAFDSRGGWDPFADYAGDNQ